MELKIVYAVDTGCIQAVGNALAALIVQTINQNLMDENQPKTDENELSEAVYIDTKVLVDKSQLQALIAQNQELRTDATAMANLFKVFSGLFTGKVSVMSIIPAITKIMNDKKQLEKLSTIIPIIEKYTENDGK